MSSTIGQSWAGRLRLAFNGSKGGAILRSLAALLVDKSIDWGTAAVTKRFPVQLDGSAGEATALALLADERGYIADPSASTTTTATNLQNAQIFARLSGTPIGMLVALNNAGFPGAVLVQVNGVAWAMNSTPTAAQLADLANMTALPSWITRSVYTNTNPPIPASTDGRPAITALTIPWASLPNPALTVVPATDPSMDLRGNQFTSRFAVYFPATATNPNLGTAANLTRIQAVIRQYRPAKATCTGITVCTAGHLWGEPGRVWGSALWGATATTYSAG